MRLAMRAGARDFLVEPVAPDALASALEQIVLEKSGTEDEHQLIALVNTKGGVGSSFLAANFAHVCQTVHGFDTVLLDLDRQFAALAEYLDVKIERGLSDAFDLSKSLDAVSLDAFLVAHRSGLKLMGERHDFLTHFGIIDSSSQRVEQFVGLLTLLDRKFDRIVADVPRNLDALGVVTLERANHIVLVIEQAIPCIRDAVRMKNILTRNLNIAPERIHVLVNRYQSNAATSLDDIQEALGCESPLMIPNHFASVSRSVDTGIPISEEAPSSPVSKALKKLEGRLTGQPEQPPQNIITRSLSSFLRS
jgi:pilus assembly protein CpaE